MNKEKFRVTVADFVIVLAVLLAGFLAYRYVYSDPAEETFEFDYVVKVSGIRSELAQKISVGDDVYSTDGEYMGRVTAYEPRGAVLGTTGQSLPDRSDLYITIEAQADGNGLVSGHRIYVERELELYTTGLSFECVCINVR